MRERRRVRGGGCQEGHVQACARIRTMTKQRHNKHGMGKKLPTPQPNTFYDLVKISLASARILTL